MAQRGSTRGRATFRLIVLVLMVGAVLALLLLARCGAGLPGGATALGAGSATVAPGHEDRFSISGNVTGLYPGASLPLVLTITNPHPFTILVTSVSTAVGTPSASCASSNLVVTEFVGNLTVPANGVSKLTVTASLSHAAPDACQRAVFPLQYSGTAVKP